MVSLRYAAGPRVLSSLGFISGEARALPFLCVRLFRPYCCCFPRWLFAAQPFTGSRGSGGRRRYGHRRDARPHSDGQGIRDRLPREEPARGSHATWFTNQMVMGRTVEVAGHASRDGMVCAAVRQAVIYWIFGGGTSTLLPQRMQMNWKSSSIPGGAAWGAPQCGQTTRAPALGGRNRRVAARCLTS